MFKQGMFGRVSRILTIACITALFSQGAIAAQSSYEFSSGDKATLTGAAATLSGNTTFTIEFWVNFAGAPSSTVNLIDFDVEGTVYGDAGGIVMFNDTITVDLGSNFASLTQSIPLTLSSGTWYHFAVVFDNGYWDFYVDGAAQGTDVQDQGANTSVPGYSTVEFVLGPQDLSTVDNFTGKMDDVRLWSTARTQQQVQDNRSVELAGNEAGLVGYWKLNEASGTTVTDSQASGLYHGSQSGVTLGVDGAFVAGDSTPPSFENSTPAVSGTTLSQTTLTVRLNEIGTAYYVVVADGAGGPSSAQVKAGQDSGGSAALANGSLNVSSASTDFTDTVTGLSAATAYDIYVVAEDDEGTPNLQSSATKVDVTTDAPDSDGDLTAAGSVSEPVGLDTTVDTVGEAVDVFDFTLSDGGTSDGLPMSVSQLVVNVSGTSTDTERSQITWRLNGPDASNVAGTYNAGADTLTFSGLGIAIADGGSETYTVNAYYNDNTNLTEDHTVILSVDGDTDVTLGTSGTLMGATSAVTNGTGTTLDVVATQLVFTTQPAGSVSGSALTTQPVVAARDAFGNTDVDFSETIALTETSAGVLSNTTQTATGGVATFTSVTYTATADQQSFTLTANDQDGVGTDLSTVDANSVTSDVVATKLVFGTEPAPTSMVSEEITHFSTVPVIRAVDALGAVDTGYSTTFTLNVTDPNDGTLDGTVNSMTGTGDTDGNGITVTLSPSSGQATYTGLSLTYTNSGPTETLALRATSGGLTATNSTEITSTVNNAPVIANLGGDNVAWAGNGDTVTLDVDGNATITDTELDALNGGNGDYAGSSMTLQRSGGAVANDVFGFDSSGALFTVSGSSLQDGGQTFATFTSDNGVLTIDFDSSQATATSALVAEVVQRVTYRNDTLTDDATVRFTLSDGSRTAFADVLVDAVRPSVSTVGVPVDSTYVAGDNLDLTVNFDDNVTVNTDGGTPRIPLTIGATIRYADYQSGSGNSAMVFRHTVQSGDQDTDGITLGGAIDANGGTLEDAVGNDAQLTLNSVGNTSGVLVDAAVPSGHSVSFDDDSLNASEAIGTSFTFANAEVGASYSYTISSSGGGTDVTGSGTIANADLQVSGVDVSALGDGTLTLSVVLTDAVNNAASAVTDTTALDTTGPALQSSTPLNSASDVPYDTGLTLVFNESVQAGSGQVAVYDAADDSLHEAITIANVEIAGQTVTATLSESLTPTHTYYVTVDSGALTDATGNGFTGFADSTGLRFTVQNSAPTAANDAVAVRQGESLAIEVLANDGDLEGLLTPASTQVTAPPAHGRVSVDIGTGVITYTPDAGYSGADSFAYRVEDEFQELSNVATVALDVTPLNQSPLAWPDVATAAPGQSVVIDLLANDESGDSGDPLDAASIQLVNRPLNGTASLDGSELSYTPNEGFSGTERMRYTVLDQDGLESNIADVLINVSAGNQPPAASDDSAATPGNTPVTVDILANDSDTDGTLAPNSVRVLVHARHGSVELDSTTGELTYTPDAGYRGEDRVAYSVSDDQEAVSETAVVTLSVGASDAPIARDDRVQLVGARQHTLNVLGNDRGANALVPGSLSVTSGPAQGSVLVDATTGQLRYTPDEGFSGTDQLSYTVSDDQGRVSNTATVTIGFEPVNHAPIANADWIELDEETSAVLPLTTNDQDIEGSLDTANITLLTQPTSGQVSVDDGGSLIYTPDEHFAGEDRFTYHIADAAGSESHSAIVRLRVTPVADVPLISGTPTTTVPAEESYRFTPVARDIDGNPLTFSIGNKPSWASFDAVTGRLAGTPGLEDVGLTEGIVITVSNGDKSATLPTFSLRVTDNSGGSQVVEDDSEPSGPTGPNGDEQGGELFQVNPDMPVLATPDTGWPDLGDGQSTAPAYSIAFIDQYGAPRRVQVTQGEGVAAPVPSGPDGDGRQHLAFTQADGSEQRVTITPQGETLVSVYAQGGDPAPVSRLTSEAATLQTTVTDGGDVISRTTVALTSGGLAKVALTQSTASGVLLTITPVSTKGIDAAPTRFQFDVVPATIRLARDGTVTAKAESTNGTGDTVALSVRLDARGYLTASTTVDDGAGDPGTSAVVASLVGVVGEFDTDANLLVAPDLAALAEQVVTVDSEGVLRYDDDGTPVAGSLGTSVVLGSDGVSTITRNGDPDLNGLRRAAEIGSSAGGTATLSRLEVTDVASGNADVHIEPAGDGDGYSATRDLGDGLLQSLLRLDGSAVHQFSRPGRQTNEARALVANTLSILFEDRAVSVAEHAASTLYVEAHTDGSVRHEVARAGWTTQAISRASGSRTRLESVDDSTDVQVVTEAELEGRQIRVIARADGSAEHRLVNQAGQVTESSFDLAGTTTSISPLGNLKSRVRLGDGSVCAWVETFSNGETSTGFGRYGSDSASCIDIQRPTNLDSAFEAGNQVEVRNDGAGYSIIVETQLTRPIRF